MNVMGYKIPCFLLSLFCFFLPAASEGLSTSNLLNYDWKSTNCECKIKSARHYEPSPGSLHSRQKQRPSLAGVLYVETPREGAKRGDHVFTQGTSVLKISPIGNRLKLPVQEDQFLLRDRSSASVRESGIDMNDTASLSVEDVSTLKSIHSRIVLKAATELMVKDHCVMYCEYASLYADDDSKFTVDWFSRVEMRHPHETLFEEPALTMHWATELVVKDHSQLTNEGGYIEMKDAASLKVIDRSKLSLGLYQYSIDKTPSLKLAKPARLFLGDQAEIKLTTGSHLHVGEGVTLFVDNQEGIHLEGSALHFIRENKTQPLFCVVFQLLNLKNEHTRITAPTDKGDPDEQSGILCAESAQKLSDKVIHNEDIFEQHRLQLWILDQNEKDVSLHPLHVDPEIPPNYETFECGSGKH